MRVSFTALFVAIVLVLTLGVQVARAAEPAGEAEAAAQHRSPPRAPRRLLPVATTVTSLPGNRTPPGCDASEDLTCTVVHETRSGIVVVTFRAAGKKAENGAWSVVNVQSSGSGTSGGTIYVVPTPLQVPQAAQPVVVRSSNDTPILD